MSRSASPLSSVNGETSEVSDHEATESFSFRPAKRQKVGEVDLSDEQAREYHQFLIQQIVCMLCSGLIHGDLSEFNVLVGANGPVIIDLPQAVSASGNNNAFAMLERDITNITETLGRFASDLLLTRYAPEMWALFEQGELTPATQLSGKFAEPKDVADLDEVVAAIDEAREEAIRREEGRREEQSS